MGFFSSGNLRNGPGSVSTLRGPAEISYDAPISREMRDCLDRTWSDLSTEFPKTGSRLKVRVVPDDHMRAVSGNEGISAYYQESQGDTVFLNQSEFRDLDRAASMASRLVARGYSAQPGKPEGQLVSIFGSALGHDIMRVKLVKFIPRTADLVQRLDEVLPGYRPDKHDRYAAQIARDLSQWAAGSSNAMIGEAFQQHRLSGNPTPLAEAIGPWCDYWGAEQRQL